VLASGAVRPRVIAVLVAATFIFPAAPLVVSADDLPGPCDLHRLEDETGRHLSKRRIRCAAGEFGPVPGDAARAICIADRESGLRPRASSTTGQYLGLYQHSAESWPSRYDEWTRPVWELPETALSGRSNAIVTIRIVADAGGWGAAGWPRGAC